MEEAQFIFTSDPIELKSEGEDFFVEGYISTSDIDLVNDLVTKSCLLDMAEQMKQRTIKLDVEHESFRGKTNLEREINKTIIPIAKIDDFLVDKKGLKIRSKLNKHSPRFNEVKGSIEEGFLDAFSIAYIPIKTAVQNKNGLLVRLLDKINLLNVAYTGNAVNTDSKITKVFAKSLEFMKEQEEKAHSAKWHRCVDHVRAAGGVRSPEAVCTAVLEEESFKSNEEDLNPRELKTINAIIKELKDYNHERDIIKLQEAKKMSEEDNKEKVDETQGSETAPETPTEPETPEEPSGDSPPETDEESAEVKALKSEVAEIKGLQEKTQKELEEVKALLKKPFVKSKAEQPDKTENFEEKKSQKPLDLIA